MRDHFRIHLLPASYGDCILLSYGNVDRPRYVLIDSGPAHTYRDVRRALEQSLACSRELELLVITHIDADHIEGAIKLLHDPRLPLSFRDVWFNGWPQLSQPLVGNVPFRRDVQENRGAMQGEYLGVRLYDEGVAWNRRFGGRSVLDPDVGWLPAFELEDGLRVTLLSPSAQKLKALRSAWSAAATARRMQPGDLSTYREKLAGDRRYRRGAAPAILEAALHQQVQTATQSGLDEAVANGSSIAFVAEFAGKRCALLGDAHTPLIEHSVARLATEYGQRRLRLDAVKLSHHGSRGNTTPSLLDRIDCDTYLVSSDGSRFGHPDDATIERILSRDAPRTRLVFNYRSEQNAKWSDVSLPRQRYLAEYPAADGAGVCVDLLEEPSFSDRP